MQRATILAAMIAAATPALAALPPQYQRADELNAVIAVATEMLGPVESVRFMTDDLYEARSGDCIVIVRIEGLPPDKASEPMAGPRQFRAVAGEPACD